jgi:hypothetical protein
MGGVCELSVLVNAANGGVCELSVLVNAANGGVCELSVLVNAAVVCVPLHFSIEEESPVETREGVVCDEYEHLLVKL